ncbi:MAG: SCO family protein [Polyangiaceae bacterium]
MQPAVDGASPRHRPMYNARFALLAALAVCALVTASIARRHARAGAQQVPAAVLGHIPSFEMPDQHGTPVSDTTLRGQVLVVDFFFASCATSCPMLTAQMASVDKAVADREQKIGRRLSVHLVSITLDPENDTPEVLDRYAARYGADASRWSFLSGRSADLDRVVVGGFKTTFQRADPGAGIATIMHGEWLVLVDGDGGIRGYYAAGDPERMVGLVHDVLDLTGAS